MPGRRRIWGLAAMNQQNTPWRTLQFRGAFYRDLGSASGRGWLQVSISGTMAQAMNVRHFFILLLLMGGLPLQPQQGRSSGQVLEMVGITAAVAWKWNPFCLWECCDEPWINIHNVSSGLFAPSGLENALKENLFGQHIVQETVLGALHGHLSNRNPPKPLVLSFHGRTGTGKNFVSRLIAESIYRKGMQSKYVHFKIADRDYRHAAKLEEYKDSLHKEVTKSIKSCPRQLFIFDEVENMPPGLLDVIRPFLEYGAHNQGEQYNKAIYIFLSNTASRDISNVVLEHMQAGKKREDITLQQLEGIIESSSFQLAGSGFEKARLIDKYLISHFVPFLPLEAGHVRQCIQTELKKEGFIPKVDAETLIEEVLQKLQFWPKDMEIFATKGCKSVVEKLNLSLYRLHTKKRTIEASAHSNGDL
ncbi:torsin-1A-like [Diadema antillarum]|uniref:torsin-1A-like n=1 Tax=Diadema antillarum TaxID=105358 RepID=UPI003A8839C6